MGEISSMLSTATLGAGASIFVSVNRYPNDTRETDSNLSLIGFASVFVSAKQGLDSAKTLFNAHTHYEKARRMNDDLRSDISLLIREHSRTNSTDTPSAMATSLNEVKQSLDFSFTSTPEKWSALMLGVIAMAAMGVIANAATENKPQGQFIGGLITLLICTSALNMLAKQVDQQTQTAEHLIDQKRIALQQNNQVLVESRAVSVLEAASEQV